MKKTLLIALAFLFTLGLAAPPAAEARVFVGVGVGGCCYGGGYGYYGGAYPYYPYYSPYYVAPPPVVYAVPPAPPTVVYQQPAPQVVYQQPPPPGAAPPPPAAVAPASAPAPDPATFIDSQGRTCRHIQATPPGSGQPYATACLQPDGTWHIVQ